MQQNLRPWKSIILSGLCLTLAQISLGQWSAPITVSGNVASDGGNPELAVTNKGNWIAVWERAPGAAALYARTNDRGRTWETTAELVPFSGWVSQGAPSIASDVTSGTFLAAWQTDNFDGIPDAGVARTAPNQTDFPAVASLGQTINYLGLAIPQIAGGGSNTWVVGGVSSNVSATDEAIQLFRSIDNGSNWTSVAALGQETSSIRFDRNFDIASDNSGTWVVVTESRAGSVGSPSDIFVRFSRSVNEGQAWTALDNIDDATPRGELPRIASGGSGRFLVLMKRGTGAGNLVAYRTSDSGAAWTAASAAVNATGLDASGDLTGHDVAIDSEGNCVAVWSAQDPAGTRKRIFFATSRDSGATWSAADYMTTPTADVAEEQPVIQYDGAGRWAAVWQRRNFGTSTTLTIQSASLIFPVRADLSVSQRDTPDPAAVDGIVTYAMTVRNDGPSSASSVKMINHTPEGAEVITVTQTKGTRTETSGTITFNFGNLNEGATATGEVQVKVGAAGIYKNVAEVFSNTEDVDLDDRISTESTRVLVEGVELTGEWQKFIPKVPKRAYKGRLSIDSKFVVQNLGNKRARGFKILLMLSDDEILSDDDALAGILNVDHLGPGNERRLDWRPKLRRYVPWQGKTVLAVIDAEMRVDEADEFNNSIASDELPAPELE